MTEAAPAVHDVLWTGGWDSTFRVLDLVLTHRRIVRPWYVTDPERRTTGRELRAMTDIRRLTADVDVDAAERILPLEERALCSIPDAPDLRDAARGMRTRTQLPVQYEWLAMFARSEGIDGLELGVEDRAGTPAFAGVTVGRSGSAAPDDWWYVEADGSPPDSYAILGSFRLPVLEMEKWEMEAIARERGYAHILEATWFCRWPTVLGRPCGFCVPCRGTRVGGLARRVPEPTRTRALLHRTRWDLARRGRVLRANAGSITRRLGGPGG